jgi:hypothetical protein
VRNGHRRWIQEYFAPVESSRSVAFGWRSSPASITAQGSGLWLADGNHADTVTDDQWPKLSSDAC